MTTILIVVCMITDACTLLNLYSAHRDYVQWKMFHGEWPELIQGQDAVSRKAIEKLKRYRFSYDINTTIPKSDLFVKLTDLRDLQSVAPVRKKGKWINKSLKIGCGFPFAISKCTCCGKNTFFDCDELLYRYCPNCGAEME